MSCRFFTALKFYCAPVIHTPLPHLLTTTDLFIASISLLFPKCLVVILQYVAFPDCLPSHSNLHLKSPPCLFRNDCSFLVLNNIPSFGCTTVYFIYSSIHLGCFKVLKIMTKTAINICVESVALCIPGSVYQPLCF